MVMKTLLLMTQQDQERMQVIDLIKLLDNGNINPVVLRDTLEDLNELVEANIFSRFEGKFYTLTYTGAVTDELFKHGLNFIPKDVILLSSNPSTVTVAFKYESESWDSTNIVLTTNGAVTIRAFIGRYRSDE